LNEPDLPCFPISVIFHEDGDKWVLNNHAEAASNLEWFDSRDEKENASVTDSNGRQVVLVVEKLELKICQLA
jgi:hypothetical protein